MSLPELWRAVPKPRHLHSDVIAADGRVVCSALPRDVGLIAAAPALLGELGKAADTFHELAHTFRIFGYPTAAQACLVAEEATRATIARATRAPEGGGT